MHEELAAIVDSAALASTLEELEQFEDAGYLIREECGKLGQEVTRRLAEKKSRPVVDGPNAYLGFKMRERVNERCHALRDQ